MDITKYLQVAKKHDKASKFIIGYTLNGIVYYATVDSIPNDRVYLKTMSRGSKCLALRLDLKTKKALLPNAKMLCKVENFKGGYNNGDTLELMLRELNGLEHKHDSIAFYQGCDMVVNGIGYSIKWEHSQLYVIDTLDRLAKC